MTRAPLPPPAILLLLTVVLVAPSSACGQTAPAATAPAATSTAGPATEDLIQLNFPENVELKVLVDYVARRLGTNILYDEQIAGKKVTIASPAGISTAALPALLRSVLHLKGFTLVASDAPGWLKIIPAGQAGGDVAVEFVSVQHADAGELVQRIKPLVAARRTTATAPASGVEVSFDPRTNQLILIGPAALLADAKKIVSAIDAPVPQEQSPVHFYKLANTTAADVLETIRSLEGGEGESEPRAVGSGSTPLAPIGAGAGRSGYDAGAESFGQLGTGRSGADLGGTRSVGSAAASAGPGLGGTRAASPLEPQPSDPRSFGGDQRPNPGFGALPQATVEAVRTKQATVTADANTNTIIVVGGPAVQRVYEQLIRTLDKRRPQVLIEATVVTLDTTDDFTLGVDLGVRASADRTQLITFSSFGLSTVDPATGRLAVVPGLGFNGALLNADVADVVLRALASNSRSKIIAAPRVLVNDNATGTLFSIAESPFTSINANNTISTTSFAGYAEAGTEIKLTPHISEDDYLQLEYV
ncbi:MAG: hypothetical protein M3478_03200, partial [Planctomycetota bacterium]|nr:hypothetical protein [Planctomycetota bacterium]